MNVQLIKKYIRNWKLKGYPKDIPDEVPRVLETNNRAPSYRAIAIAILKNDSSLKSLGFTPKASKYYNELKRLEIEVRENI